LSIIHAPGGIVHRWLVIPALVAATTTALPAGAELGVDAQVRAVMAQMSLTDKVEQMFVSYVYGTSATVADASDVANNQALYGTSVTDGADLLAQYHLGGIIYFSWANGLTDPQAIGALSNGLQQAAMAGANPIPVQISTDQEGGIVNRIGAPVAVSPGNLAIGATFNPADAYRAASVSGTELRAMGINMDDAPVVDVNTNPRNSADGPRSFGDRPAMVSALGAAAVLGYQRAGVAAQAKHFPGLGRVAGNTDFTTATDTTTTATDPYLQSFKDGIAANADFVMVALALYTKIDSNHLAAFSSLVMTQMLRNSLGFGGVIISDDLGATAAVASIPPGTRAIDFLSAGGDMIISKTAAPADAMVQAIRARVAADATFRQRVDDAALQVLKAKQAYGLLPC